MLAKHDRYFLNFHSHLKKKSFFYRNLLTEFYLTERFALIIIGTETSAGATRSFEAWSPESTQK